VFVTGNREFDQHFRTGSLTLDASWGVREGAHLDYQVDSSLSYGRHDGLRAGEHPALILKTVRFLSHWSKYAKGLIVWIFLKKPMTIK